MTKNITLRMDDELLKKAKHVAVENDMSLSSWIAGLVERETEKNGFYNRDRYERARTFLLKAMEEAKPYGGGTFTREEIHERRRSDIP